MKYQNISILIIAIILASCAATNTPNQGAEFTISKEHKLCETNEDCTGINTDCDSCKALHEGVNIKYSNLYTYEKMCDNHLIDNACDRIFEMPIINCKNNLCIRVV